MAHLTPSPALARWSTSSLFFTIETALPLLAACIHSHRLSFLNDAAAYTLGGKPRWRHSWSSPRSWSTLGTGIGAAFAIDGQHVDPAEGVPRGGEIWNYPYAGGIVEDLISTRRIKADYLTRTGHDREVVDIAVSSPDLSRTLAPFSTPSASTSVKFSAMSLRPSIRTASSSAAVSPYAP